MRVDAGLTGVLLLSFVESVRGVRKRRTCSPRGGVSGALLSHEKWRCRVRGSPVGAGLRLRVPVLGEEL